MPHPNDYPKVHFQITPETQAALAARAREGESLSIKAREMLERALMQLQLDLRSLRGRFTVNEITLMADAANGVMFEPHTIPHYAIEIEDYLELSGPDRFNVDGTALLEKIKDLTPGQTFALVDAVERWWRGAAEGLGADRAGFAQVGLVASDD